MLELKLTPAHVADWNRDHVLVVRKPFSDAQVAQLRGWVDEISSWAETPGKWMKYFETSKTTGQRQLCRVENFIPFHPELRDLLYGDSIKIALHQLMGEPANLFKEKINFKLSGGAGFAGWSAARRSRHAWVARNGPRDRPRRAA